MWFFFFLMEAPIAFRFGSRPHKPRTICPRPLRRLATSPLPPPKKKPHNILGEFPLFSPGAAGLAGDAPRWAVKNRDLGLLHIPLHLLHFLFSFDLFFSFSESVFQPLPPKVPGAGGGLAGS